MKIKRKRWGGEGEEDRRGTDEGTQRGDDEMGCEKWLTVGEKMASAGHTCAERASGQIKLRL